MPASEVSRKVCFAVAIPSSIRARVDSIVGPGNQWVTEAKRQVAGQVRIDAPAGPSELLVVADDTADPDLIALELLAQAEHDPEAVVGLVSPSAPLVRATRASLETALSRMDRRHVARQSLAGQGFLLRADTLELALRFAERFAAEHLWVWTRDSDRDAGQVTTAGTVFVGPGSSVASVTT